MRNTKMTDIVIHKLLQLSINTNKKKTKEHITCFAS